MNKDGKLSLAVKWGFYWTYTNENSNNGNQKVTPEYGVFFPNKNHLQTFHCAV